MSVLVDELVDSFVDADSDNSATTRSATSPISSSCYLRCSSASPFRRKFIVYTVSLGTVERAHFSVAESKVSRFAQDTIENSYRDDIFSPVCGTGVSLPVRNIPEENGRH